MKITFIGAGSMAEALIAGMTKANVVAAEHITATNRSNEARLQQLQAEYGIAVGNVNEALIAESDIVVLTMKPKDAEQALLELAPLVTKRQLILSVMAGVETRTMEQYVGDIAVVRSMPNTSAALNQSATAVCRGRFVTDEQMAHVLHLFSAVGVVKEVAEENMHAVTGLSGSGPAYVYYLVEAMEQAAEQIGLGGETGKALILQTIIGAAEMLKQTPKQPAVLRREVTSPNGTTEAGIGVLQSYQFQEAIVACITRATERSFELGAEKAKR